MKKCISILVLLALVSVGGAFAVDLSLGGGLLFDYSANNGVEAEMLGYKMYTGFRNSSFGGFFFLDATYVELDLSFAYGTITNIYESNVPGDLNLEEKATALQFGIALLGKYPFNLGPVTLFPLLGISYNSVLSLKDPDSGESYTNAGDFSQLGFLGGIGADFNISDSLYIRAEGLFHLRLASKYQKELVKESGGLFDTTLGMGPVIKVAVGFKL